MKVAPRIPESLRIIDLDRFLNAVDKRKQMLLRAQAETPGLHLLALFTDSAERFALLEDIGPRGKHKDLKHAVAHGPAALRLAYIIPCAECPPVVIPPNLARCDLPGSLAPLTAPPAGFHEESAAPHPAPATPPAAPAEPPESPAKPGSRAPFGFALEKKGIRLPSPEDKLLQLEIELRDKRAAFESECAERLREFEERELDLTQREHRLAARKAELLDLLHRFDALRHRFEQES